MLEAAALGLFIAGLLLCIVLDYSILYALVFGLVVFILYGLVKKHSFLAMLKMSFGGIKTIKNVIFVFMMIGALTAVWRASGTIPYIIFHAAKLISPSVFVPATFLLCCGISLLTGTSFGTAATMGVICMMMGRALGISPLWLGGAVLAGAFFGDRCSPMSTSALLVSELTDTDIYRNIPQMIKTSAVPFAISCALYLLLGLLSKPSQSAVDTTALFAQSFNLLWVCMLPALLIVILSVFRVNVKITIALSIVCGSVICLAVQKIGITQLLSTLVLGFKADNPRLSLMMNGGGLVSMLSPTAIVCISACYAGIFEGTGMLERTKTLVFRLSRSVTPFGAVSITSLFTAMVGCNQTLAIMLTHQLCTDIVPRKEKMAITLENTAVVLSPLIPWSIAGAVPLTTVSAPMSSLFFAFYLYLIPICNWLLAAYRCRRISFNKRSSKQGASPC